MNRKNDGLARIVHLVYPCDLKFLSLLNTVIGEVLDGAGVDEETGNAIANAVMEAGTNASQYGGEGKDVEVEFWLGDQAIEVVVSDSGPGFDPDRVSESGGDSEPLALRGRGILIMKTLMDEVSFESGADGTTVRLKKVLSTEC